MNLIKSSGAALGAAILSFGPSEPARGYFLASISLGRDHEVGIVEPREQEPVKTPAPYPGELDAEPGDDRRDERTAA